ncbi:hypothetical protein ACOME3_007742 [Neoechinorhynchus agilis]
MFLCLFVPLKITSKLFRKPKISKSPMKIVWHDKGKSGDWEPERFPSGSLNLRAVESSALPAKRESLIVVDQITESDSDFRFTINGDLAKNEGLSEVFSLSDLMTLAASTQPRQCELALKILRSIVQKHEQLVSNVQIIRRLLEAGYVIRIRMLMDCNCWPTIHQALCCLRDILYIQKRRQTRVFFINPYFDHQMRCQNIHLLNKEEADQYSNHELCAQDPVFGLVCRTNILRRFAFLLRKERQRSVDLQQYSTSIIIDILSLMLEHSNYIAICICECKNLQCALKGEDPNCKAITELLVSAFLTRRCKKTFTTLYEAFSPFLFSITKLNLGIISVITVLRRNGMSISDQYRDKVIEFAVSNLGKPNTMETVLTFLSDVQVDKMELVTKRCIEWVDTNGLNEEFLLFTNFSRTREDVPDIFRRFLKEENAMKSSLIAVCKCILLNNISIDEDLIVLILDRIKKIVFFFEERPPIPDPAETRIIAQLAGLMLEICRRSIKPININLLIARTIHFVMSDQRDLGIKLLTFLRPDDIMTPLLIKRGLFEFSYVDQKCDIQFHLEKLCPVHYMFPLDWFALVPHFVSKCHSKDCNDVSNETKETYLINGLKLWLDIERWDSSTSKSTQLALFYRIFSCLNEYGIPFVIVNKIIRSLTIDLASILMSENFLSSSDIDLDDLNPFTGLFWTSYEQFTQQLSANSFNDKLFVVCALIPLLCEHFQRIVRCHSLNEMTIAEHVFASPTSVFNMRNLCIEMNAFSALLTPLLKDEPHFENNLIYKTVTKYLRLNSKSSNECLLFSYCSNVVKYMKSRVNQATR